MKAILKRLRRLETVAIPDEKERAAVEAILEARRLRLGSDYEPIAFPRNSFVGCRTIADRILRARKTKDGCRRRLRHGRPACRKPKSY
jgi:hypothetical protein